jgi:hypothetical protein
MPQALQKVICWLCIALLAILMGIGAPALHSLPGCGHGIQVGNRIILLGICLARVQSGAQAGQQFERGTQDIPIYDDNECVICSTVGHNFAPAHSPQFAQVIPLVHKLPTAVHRAWREVAAYSFHARAPPLV